jgi:hypothetical protein
MENNIPDLKAFAKQALEGINGMVKFAEAQTKKTLEDLKKQDPKLAEQKAREFAEAMKAGNMDEGFSKLKTDIEGLEGMFKGH